MLKHITAVHDIKVCVDEGKAFANSFAILNSEALLYCMSPRYGERRLRRVDASNVTAKVGELLSQQPSTTPYVKRLSVFGVDLEPILENLNKVAETTRVEKDTQGVEYLMLVPPRPG